MSQLIVALDFDTLPLAMKLIDQLDPQWCALKVGSEMFTLFGTDFVKTLVKRQFKVFLDLKFHDIPHTVAQACKASADLGVWMMNVHALGGLDMMQSAQNALCSYGPSRPLLIAVTVLTSMDTAAFYATGIGGTLEERVKTLALSALEAKLDGVVSSAHEVPMIKSACGDDFLCITPGIRSLKNPMDDQARVMTPEQAIKTGSNYLVIGRPITQALNPVQVIQDILFVIT